jgi:lipid-binding SYLF domain-containing protein
MERRLTMIARRITRTSRAPGAQIIAVAMGITLLATVARPGWAGEALETRQLVQQARFTLENFQADPMMGGFRDLAKRARGVFVAPQLLKAAFVVGASGGSGVLVVRDEHTGQWHGPAFYTLGGASFGFQIGAEASEVVVLAMTERGVNAMLQPSVKLGADASLAVGPVGMGVEGATENLSADLVAFSRSKGLYGGVSVQGAVLGVRTAWNKAYYGKPVTPRRILIHGEKVPQAEDLLATVRHFAGPRSG